MYDHDIVGIGVIPLPEKVINPDDPERDQLRRAPDGNDARQPGCVTCGPSPRSPMKGRRQLLDNSAPATRAPRATVPCGAARTL